MDMKTSGAWVASLTERFSKMDLYSLEYNLIWRDGSLNWSSVSAMRLEGPLIGPGVKEPLLATMLAARRRSDRMARASIGLRTSDPFANASAGQQRARGRGGGRGRNAPTSGPANRHGRSRAAQGGNAPPTPPPHPLAAIAAYDASAGEDGDGPTEAAADDGGAFGMEDELDMFDLDKELAGLLDDDLAELAETFDGDAAQDLGGAGDEASSNMAMDPTVAEQLEQDVQAALVATGLGADNAPNNEAAAETQPLGQASDAAASSGRPAEPEALPVEAVASAESDLDRAVGPSPAGYVTLGERTVGRILRGNPKGSCSVRCYRHRGCSFLITLRDAPPDAALLAWLFEVPAAGPDASSDESKALAAQHVALADRWRSKRRQKAVAKASGAGGSS